MDTNLSTGLRTVPAKEIKRRGISAVDELIAEGAVHVIREDRPQYVVLTEEQYNELVEGNREGYVARVRAALNDAESGLARELTAEQLIGEFQLDA